ncbi:WD40-repeat-containing domain protein [Sparassis latifolia]
MSTLYKHKATLTGEHSGPINRVAFSPDGLYLASAGTDGKLVVWSTQTGKALHAATAASPLLSLIWLQSSRRIVFGSHDGTLTSVVLREDMLTFSGLSAHDKPIECLSFCEGLQMLASGAHDQCKIWSVNNKSPYEPKADWVAHAMLPKPPSFRVDSDVLVTLLHWLENGSRPSLVVTYLNHGIMCYCSETLTSLWNVALEHWYGSNSPTIETNPSVFISGAASFSPNKSYLAFSNLRDEFYVCAIPSGVIIHKFCTRQHPQWSSPLPVAFLYDGFALADHPVQAMAVHPGSPRSPSQVATATSNATGPAYIYIWSTACAATTTGGIAIPPWQ